MKFKLRVHSFRRTTEAEKKFVFKFYEQQKKQDKSAVSKIYFQAKL